MPRFDELVTVVLKEDTVAQKLALRRWKREVESSPLVAELSELLGEEEALATIRDFVGLVGSTKDMAFAKYARDDYPEIARLQDGWDKIRAVRDAEGDLHALFEAYSECSTSLTRQIWFRCILNARTVLAEQIRDFIAPVALRPDEYLKEEEKQDPLPESAE